MVSDDGIVVETYESHSHQPDRGDVEERQLRGNARKRLQWRRFATWKVKLLQKGSTGMTSPTETACVSVPSARGDSKLGYLSH